VAILDPSVLARTRVAFSSVVLSVLLTLALAMGGCAERPAASVVVYTSLDQPLSEPVLRDFEAETGIRVQAVYDVEAAKTTGLVSRLAAERDNPKAHLFWSSEYAQTIRLKEQGLLDRYDSPSAASIPASYKDPDRFWTGFAARARVIIVNTNLVPPEHHPRSIYQLLDPYWQEGDVGIANPLFGTAATHAAALFTRPGADEAKAYFQTLRDRKVRIVDGNSVVRDMVASGELKVGLTDTDDAQAAIERGAPVRMIFPDQDEGAIGTLVIPNTVALVKGAAGNDSARRLLDYLLSPEVEAKLASSGSLQMPVRDDVPVPPEVPRLSSLRPMKVAPEEVAAQFPASSEWLKDTFLR